MPEFTTTDSARLSYTVEGSGPAIVFIAGFTAPATMWGLNTAPMRAAGYQTVTLDRRSHGLSQSPTWGQRISRHGKDILELIALLELHDPVLVGASMGASSCWAAADLSGFHGIKSIVSVDQSPKMINDRTWQHGFYGLTNDNVGTFFQDGIPQTGKGLPADVSAPGLATLSAQSGKPMVRDPDAAETRPLLFDHAVQDWRDLIERCPVPLLMMAGAGSQLWPVDHITAGGGNPNVFRSVIDDAGHTVNIDQPERFNDTLLHFLHGTLQP